MHQSGTRGGGNPRNPPEAENFWGFWVGFERNPFRNGLQNDDFHKGNCARRCKNVKIFACGALQGDISITCSTNHNQKGKIGGVFARRRRKFFGVFLPAAGENFGVLDWISWVPPLVMHQSGTRGGGTLRHGLIMF